MSKNALTADSARLILAVKKINNTLTWNKLDKPITTIKMLLSSVGRETNYKIQLSKTLA